MTNENPYQAPVHVSSLPLPDGAQLLRLKGIAESQRRVMLCVLGQIAIFAGTRMAAMESWVVGLAYILVAILTLACTVQLAYRTKGTGTAVVVGVLSVVPFLGLLMMLFASGWATKELKAAGFKVGLLGGRPKEVQAAIDRAGGGNH
jgi:hypothetical protein